MSDDRPFSFDLYRLNIVDRDHGLFDSGSTIRRDADISAVIEHATKSGFDQTLAGPRARYQWGLRDFLQIEVGGSPVFLAKLARSVTGQAGPILTDAGIVEGTTQIEPPLAQFMTVIFYMNRHLVAIEPVPALYDSRWHAMLEHILDESAKSLGYLSSLSLESMPEDNEVLRAFRSFDVLKRIRVRLRLPNPDLSRYTRNLAEDLKRSGIREYLQDMRNPNGLSQDETSLPFASAALAQAGYKDGDVRLEGIQENRKTTIVTGKHAARGEVDGLKDFIRGIEVTAQAKETKLAVQSILNEMDRIAPREPER